MKRLFVIGLLVGASIALADSALPHSQFLFSSVQPGTQAAPDSGTSKGMVSLYQARSLHPVVQCTNDGGITAGSLVYYYCSGQAGVGCGAGPTANNCTLQTGASQVTQECQEFSVGSPFGYAGWMTSGVTCGTGYQPSDAGTIGWDGGVNVYIEVSQ